MMGNKAAVALLTGWLCLGVASSAFASSTGRVFEMVSPTYKGGYGALHIDAVAPDGDSVAYYSPGVFAETPSGAETLDYVAHRTESDWVTDSIAVPYAMAPYAPTRDVSPDLRFTLAAGKPGPSVEAAFFQGVEQYSWLHAVDAPDSVADWTPGQAIMATNGEPFATYYEGASPDLCHLLFSLSEQPLVSQATEYESRDSAAYEENRGCNGETASLRVVGLNNASTVINRSCITSIGSKRYIGREAGLNPAQSVGFNEISDDGSEVFFESGVGKGCSPHELYVRLGGAKTLELSRPIAGGECVGEVGGSSGEVPCAGASTRHDANFIGASEDGSRVFFATRSALVGTDESYNLYMATIGCPTAEPGCRPADREVASLTDVSSDPNAGESVKLQGVVRVSPDGSRVYYVALGDMLTESARDALEAEKRPVPRLGADNLYVYDTASGTTSFIADLCSGPQASGQVEEQRCPATLEAGEGKTTNDDKLWSAGEAQVNTCGRVADTSCEPGRYLVFSTYARLNSSDTNEARDVYRYDAITEKLERISRGEAGYHGDGNCDAGEAIAKCDATIAPGEWGERVLKQYEMGTRAVSADGSRVVFTTAEPLSPGAVNDQVNAYEWHDGSVSLVSSGLGEPVEDVVISPEGNDIFFVTTEGLVPSDTDGAPDVYDARVNGGFAQPPAPVESCSGDGCQGPLTNPAPVLVPSSEVQRAGGNFAPPSKPKQPKHKTRPKATKRKALPRRRPRSKTALKPRSKRSSYVGGPTSKARRGRARK